MILSNQNPHDKNVNEISGIKKGINGKKSTQST